MKFICIPILFLITYQLQAQVTNTNSFIVFENDTFVKNDSIFFSFCDKNPDGIDLIHKKIIEFPINKCQYKTITIRFYFDKAGILKNVELIKGSEFKQMDLQIKDSIFKTPAEFVPAMENNFSIPIAGKIEFAIFNNQTKLRNIGSRRSIGDHYVEDIGDKAKCKDADFYYGEGVKKFQSSDYKSAVHFFKKAIDNNKYDADATYNLGVCYVKLENIEEACNWFSKSADFGDPAGVKAVTKYCSH